MKSRKMKAYGLPWTIRALKKHPDFKDSVGVCDVLNCEILIANKYSEGQQSSALLHELIELVNEVNGLDIPENTVKALESGLYHIIHDNKLKF